MIEFGFFSCNLADAFHDSTDCAVENVRSNPAAACQFRGVLKSCNHTQVDFCTATGVCILVVETIYLEDILSNPYSICASLPGPIVFL